MPVVLYPSKKEDAKMKLSETVKVAPFWGGHYFVVTDNLGLTQYPVFVGGHVLWDRPEHVSWAVKTAVLTALVYRLQGSEPDLVAAWEAAKRLSRFELEKEFEPANCEF